MHQLIQKVILHAPEHPMHGKKADLLIRDGIIREIAEDLFPDESIPVFNADGATVSAGWCDLFAHFGEPGQEYRETLKTGMAAASAGGFTDVCLIPNNKPVTDNKAQVEYFLARNAGSAVSLHPLGAISSGIQGKELAEMYDMKQAGALAFTDGIQPVQHAGLLLKALQYVRAFDGLIIQIPDDQRIAPGGLMHEGIVSTRIGLAGKPELAETILIARDIELIRYTNSRIHFSGISCAASVELIRKAKSEGLKVTCSVTPFHLFFTDADLADYNTNLKFIPPLRPEADRTALRKGLADGTIDAIASHHLPQAADHKICEFAYAKPGAISLETSFAAALTAMGPQQLNRIIDALTIQPRQLLQLPQRTIAVGEPASLTLFNPNLQADFSAQRSKSAAANSPFFNVPLQGRVIATYHQQQFVLHTS